MGFLGDLIKLINPLSGPPSSQSESDKPPPKSERQKKAEDYQRGMPKP